VYKQAPYQEISEEEYLKAMESFPQEIRWDELRAYETADNTTVEHELACTGDKCELS
jgi:hypothetical protein